MVAAALVVARAPVVHPGHPDLPEVPRQTDDLDWMPIVAQKDLIVIIRDKLAKKAEWEAFNAQGLRVIRIASKGDLSIWATVRLIAGAWDRIEELVRTAGPGPWLAVLDSAGTLRMRIAGPTAAPEVNRISPRSTQSLGRSTGPVLGRSSPVKAPNESLSSVVAGRVAGRERVVALTVRLVRLLRRARRRCFDRIGEIIFDWGN
jgi:hypothetical protein